MNNFAENFEFDVQTICSVDTVSFDIDIFGEDGTTHTGLTITSSVLI